MQGQLKPHRTRYWLNPNIDDETAFRDNIEAVCDLYQQAPEMHAQGIHVFSTATLVEWIAKACGIDADLGVKGESGILKDMNSRAAFLQDKSHRIRFVYTCQVPARLYISKTNR